MPQPTGDLTEKELQQVEVCVAAIRMKEQGSDVYGPAMLIADTVDRLVTEVRRWRSEAKARNWLLDQPEALK